MKKTAVFRLFSMAAVLLLVLSSFITKDRASTIKTIDYYGDAKHSGKLVSLIQAELNAKRKPVLFFTATWCAPCKKFKSSLIDSLMQDALRDVTFIMIDADLDAAQEHITKKYSVSAFPTFIKVDASGTSLKKIDGGAWDEDVPANMAPVMKKFVN